MLASSSMAQSKKVWLSYADEYFGKGDYASALKYYQLCANDSLSLSTQVIPYEIVISNQKLKDKKKDEEDSSVTAPLSEYIPHQIAVCFQKIYDYKNAAENFKKTAKSSFYSDDEYHLAVEYMKLKEYDSALATFQRYIDRPTKNDSLSTLAIQQMIGCRYAVDDDNYKKEVQVKMADTAVFNKGTSAFAAMYFGYKERVLFSAAREGGVILDPEKQDSRYLSDLYWTEKINDSTWSPANNFGRPLNSASNDASGAFTTNNVIFFNRWSNEDPNKVEMYLARMLDFRFFEAYKLDSSINYPNSMNINPFITKDNTTLLFSSNRPGGKGGFDIWKVKLDINGNTIGVPENLGYPVNSEFDEKTPFYHTETNTLFFSSNGHNSIGGLDIYKSAFNVDDSAFAIPKNLGLPINSSKDDAYMIWDEAMKTGFFSSDRDSCEGGHCYDIYTVINEPIHIFLEGYVFDKNTEDIIPGATLTFKDIRSQFPDFTLKSDENGYYKLELQQKWEVFIKAQKKDYFADATNIDTRNITETTTLTHDFYLEKIPTGEIQIEGIEYDFNSANLRPESKVVLDKLFDFIQLNDNMKIQINSHTDARGSDKYNLDLSQRRAQSCVDYLVEKGVAKERLIAIGYGETKPTYLKDSNKELIMNENGEKIQLTEEYINSKGTKDEKEELHQRNRRTAFEVVSQGNSE
jgi:outer membrane protein OmpA-like peptidoglycan-associated protein/tetratricopeptide (TPR) repeat protein